MSYKQVDLEKIVIDAYELVKKQQPMLFMKKHNIHERTISTELKSAMEGSLRDFHVNCEYNRMTDEHGIQIPKRIRLDPYSSDPSSVYPDIIVHRQEDGLHNLLIIEIKMSWKNSGKDNDLDKLALYIKELKYKYGLYLEIGEEKIVEWKWFSS